MPEPLKTWPLAFEAGIEVNAVALDGEMIPLPARRMWFKRAKGSAALFDNVNGQYYVITLYHDRGTRMQQAGDWLGGDGLDKLNKWQLEKIAKQVFPKVMKIAGGMTMSIIGGLLDPTDIATEQFMHLPYKGKMVHITMLGF